MNKIYMVGGSKGGVGKSIVSIALIDYLRVQNKEILLIETDTSNPDVYLSHEEKAGIEAVALNLDDRNGWIELVNLLEKTEKPVVINTAARSSPAVSSYGETLNIALSDLNRELVVFWIINRHRDSVKLLRDFMDAIPLAQISVLRNLYFGNEDKFEIFNKSKTAQKVQAFNFPDLADRVSGALYDDRLTISEALEPKKLPMGDRAELQRWKNECHETFNKAISNGKAAP